MAVVLERKKARRNNRDEPFLDEDDSRSV